MPDTPHLDDADLSRKLSKKEFSKLLREAQIRLVGLRTAIIKHRIPIMIAFEGWDAGGKGGTIRRIREYMDNRLLDIHAVAAPTPEELDHHYLWRFWKHIPPRGHMTIFDRSWYGRVLVERIEGFARKQEWQRAYQEINEFERQLADDGYLILKFFLHISLEEQGNRFDARKKDPLKSWKLNEEDYRNRERHDEYKVAINDMLEKTHTEHAPWHVIAGNNKRYARVETINRICEAIENYVKKLD